MSGGGDAGAPHYLFPKRYADVVAKLRVPFGFVLLIAFAWLSNPSSVSLLVGLPICLLGLAIRAWAAGYLAKNQTLATDGPFAYVRNPLYSGTLTVAAGIVIASRNVILALIFAAVFFLVYFPVIELEEQHLRNIFPDYADYATRVGRWIPTFKQSNESGHFSWALYRRNEEYKALLGFVLAVAWLFWKCWAAMTVS